MKILRIILFFPLALFRLFLVVFITGVIGSTGWIKLKFFGFSRHLQQWVLHTWGKSILFVLGIKIDKNAIPQHQNFILMPNHRSYIDIFIVAGLTPATMVGKAELKRWPFGKLGMKITNSILVDRSEMRSLLTTMNKIKASVKSNIPVVLFPEGTTYKGPLTGPFKNGSFKIAADALIPVIPMAIHYQDENDAWVDKDTFVGHFFRQMGKPVSKVYLQYGEPILHSDYKRIKKETREQIDTMLTAIIEKID